MRLLGSAAVALAALSFAGAPGPALAAPYDFVPAPQTDLNRIYRIDRVTGEVSSCQYGLQEGTIGVTLCFSAGEGAGAQIPGEYGLVASRHERGAPLKCAVHETRLSIKCLQTQSRRADDP